MGASAEFCKLVTVIQECSEDTDGLHKQFRVKKKMVSFMDKYDATYFHPPAVAGNRQVWRPPTRSLVRSDRCRAINLSTAAAAF